MPIGNLTQCAAIGKSAGCAINYTFSDCIHTYSTLANASQQVFTPAGLMCTVVHNLPYFWSVMLVFFYLAFFAIFAMQPTRRRIIVVGTLGLIIATILVSASQIPGQVYASAWAIWIFCIIISRFTPKPN